MGRVIITIDEIVAGRGLRSNKSSRPPALEIFLGNGLKYGDDENLSINAGPGLGFAPVPVVFEEEEEQFFEGRLKDRPGLININEGPALMVMNEELAGIGLLPGPGCQLDIDTTPDPASEQSFRVVTDAKFQMDGYRLVFATTYTTFRVHRNQAGVVLGVEQGDSVVELQPLNIDGYGYGSGPPILASSKKPASQPSFYKA